MEDKIPAILEHEILTVLYTRVSLIRIGEGTINRGHSAVFKRDHSYSTMHFGTLVDILNNPEKYEGDRISQNLKTTIIKHEEVEIKKYSWEEVSDAVEVLATNGHINDSIIGLYDGRVITLTQKGALDYRAKYYIKEAEKELSVIKSYQLLKKELWEKKHWYLIEIGKYIIGGIVGALIALAATQAGKLLGTKSEKTEKIKANTTTYVKKGFLKNL